MIGSVLGTAAKVGGTIFGGAKAAQLAKKQNKIIDAQEKDNQNWFDRRYNESYTQRSDAQALINRVNDMMLDRSKRSAGVNAVMGGTTETDAAQKAAQNNALGGVIANIASQASAHKDDIENNYLYRKDALANARLNVLQGRQQNIMNAVGQVSGMGDSVGSLFQK